MVGMRRCIEFIVRGLLLGDKDQLMTCTIVSGKLQEGWQGRVEN